MMMVIDKNIHSESHILLASVKCWMEEVQRGKKNVVRVTFL